MGTSENFCLRWNDFESNVSGAFRELREDSDFFDVTLATSDSGNRTLQAHKVILSACSNFFKQMLRQQTRAHAHPHPFIYLRGVSYNDLLSVLDFMYHGEVNVAQDDLNSFLAVAEELQIKGLTNKEQSESASTPGPSSKARPTPVRVRDSGGPPLKRARKMSPGRVVAKTDNDDDDDIKEINVKVDPDVAHVDEAVNPEEEGYDESFGEYYGDDGSGGMEGDGTEDDPTAGGSGDGAKEYYLHQGEEDPAGAASRSFGIVRLQTGQGKCLACGKVFSNIHNCRTHFREVHTGDQGDHECHICGAKFRHGRSKANHLMKKHGISQKMLKYAQIVP